MFLYKGKGKYESRGFKNRKGKFMPGVLITSFRPEVQQKILANQDKYNPDKNELIDANEIGQLLSDFKVTNVEDLQKAKSLMDKVNDYLFPKVDVMPAQGDGYRIVYTDGDEKFLSEDEANGFLKGDNELPFVGAVLYSVGAGGSALATVVNIYEHFINKYPGSGKRALVFGALSAGFTFLAKKCLNACENESNIKSKIKMIDNDRILEEQKRAEECRQQELEYRERLNAAISGIEQNLNSSAVRSKQVNAKLRQASAQTDSIMNKLKND